MGEAVLRFDQFIGGTIAWDKKSDCCASLQGWSSVKEYADEVACKNIVLICINRGNNGDFTLYMEHIRRVRRPRKVIPEPLGQYMTYYAIAVRGQSFK